MRLRSCFRLLFFPAVVCATAALLCATPAERRAKLAVSGARSLPEAAAASTMRGPVVGYVLTLDGSALRVVLGIPGASVFGDSVILPAGVTRLRLAPRQEYALAEMAGGPALTVLALEDGTVVSETLVEGAIAADMVAFSPAGRSAALFSREASVVQVLSGLPGEPRVTWEYDTRQLTDLPDLMAVSDDGESVVVGGGGNRLSLLMRDGSARFIFAAGGLAAAAFFPGRSDLAVCDRAPGSVWVIENVAGSASTWLLAVGLDRFDGPISLAILADGGGVLIANSGGKRIWWIDLASVGAREIEAPSNPLLLERMRHGDTFLLSAEPGEPAWILAREGSEVRLLFVPAMRGDDPPPVLEGTRQ